MNKPSKFALAIAVALSSGVASAQSVDNWVSNFGLNWKNGTDEYCWRDNFWTPATAAEGCGATAKVDVTAKKVTFNADTFFDFDRATLKPEGRNVLDQVAEQVQKLNLESLIAVGHTDSVGSEKYNQRLSERRAASVKSYLVSKGVPADQIIASGRGESQPVASNATREGRAKNRRVEIEIVGTPR
ncbi:outer membrane protein OmpA [Pelistega europaea]|uniref:OmpA family protein n=1 Tax=Pelistega europaea TaxID=106147 RepID=A0A7Y4LAX6_9BURK|nr:OmpA family protein [Pelistega europaea]NOL50224.1 OmpA family protein [Pelistega europaea]